MTPLELIAVGFIHLTAQAEGREPEEMAKQFHQEANKWLHPSRKELINATTDQQIPALVTAKAIYKDYPRKTSVRKKITKKPSEDIDAICQLVLKYGDDKVTAAFEALIKSTEYLPDLCRGIKKVAAELEAEAYEKEAPREEEPKKNNTIWQ